MTIEEQKMRVIQETDRLLDMMKTQLSTEDPKPPYPDGFLVEVKFMDNSPWRLCYSRVQGPIGARENSWDDTIHLRWGALHAHRPAMPPAWPFTELGGVAVWLPSGIVVWRMTVPEYSYVTCMTYEQFIQELIR